MLARRVYYRLAVQARRILRPSRRRPPIVLGEQFATFDRDGAPPLRLYDGYRNALKARWRLSWPETRLLLALHVNGLLPPELSLRAEELLSARTLPFAPAELRPERSRLADTLPNRVAGLQIVPSAAEVASLVSAYRSTAAVEAAAQLDDYSVINIGHPDVRPIEELAELVRSALDAPRELVMLVDLPERMTLAKRPTLDRQRDLLGVEPGRFARRRRRPRHERDPALARRGVSRLRVLLLYAETPENRTLSYQRGWPRSMLAHPRLDCDPVDLASREALVRLAMARASRYDAVVLLHSVFSNAPALRGAALRRVAAMRRPRALFLGNEYKLMPGKMEFADRLGISLLVSQLSSSAAHELYRRRVGCAVVGIPNTGLDTEVFSPRTARSRRPIDLGYRSYDAPYFIGNRERRILALDVPRALAGRGLLLDVSLDPEQRLDETAWAAFLDRCKGQLGSEAGGDYFELTDETRLHVNAYLEEHPDAPFDEIFERFFRDYEAPVSGRALSGRVVEAAGTKTVQIIEGEYGGFFLPGVHYIPLRKDLANIDDAVETFFDEPRAAEIADAAYEVAQTELTYARLIDRFVDALEAVL
jgi:hypothetical protein